MRVFDSRDYWLIDTVDADYCTQITRKNETDKNGNYIIDLECQDSRSGGNNGYNGRDAIKNCIVLRREAFWCTTAVSTVVVVAVIVAVTAIAVAVAIALIRTRARARAVGV